MQVEVEYKPISQKDYELFIKILARMLAEYIRKNKEKKAEMDKKDCSKFIDKLKGYRQNAS